MPRIEINPTYCKGCLFCADVCPQDVIGVPDAVNEKGFQYAVALNPDNCIGCAMCATMCPDAAIEVYK